MPTDPAGSFRSQSHAPGKAPDQDELRRVVDTIPGLVWTAWPDGQADFANQRWYEYTGLTLDQARGWGWKAAFSSEDLPRLLDYWTTILSTGEPGEVEARVRRHDGEFRWFLIRFGPLRDPDGAIVKWVGTSTDIEDRRRAEEALRASELNLRLMIDTLPGFVATWSPEGELEFVNRPLLDYLGTTQEEMLKRHSMVMHPDDRERARTAWNRSVETGAPYDIELRVRRADGAYRWLHTRGLPVRDSEGRILRWYKLATDIDDRKKAEEALRASQAELAHINRVTSMGELAASIAHELNQPLAAVVTHGQAGLRWLNRATPNIAEVRLAIERMIHDGNRGSEVIARVRALMKKEPPARQRLDLNEVVREIVALMPLQDVMLQTDLAGELAPVLADRVQLQQVLLNLVGNAVDAMKYVSDRPRALFFRTTRVADSISVSVRDSGAGVAPDQWDRLFEPFHTTKPEGLGMGLTISRSIIESHGGRLLAERNADHGMTFSFTLPVSA